MKIVIAGCGAVGEHLAELLSREEQDIVLIDTDRGKLSQMDANLNVMTEVGSPVSPLDLKNAGVHGADLFIAVTPDESRNLTACMLASRIGAKKTLARITNDEYLSPENQDFFASLGVEKMVYPEQLASVEIVQSLQHPWARQWWELKDGKLLLIGVKIRSNASIVNKHLYDLAQKKPYYHLVAIKRGEETIIPRGGDMVMTNDIVYFTVLPDFVEDLRMMCGKVVSHIKNVMIMGGNSICVLAANALSDNMNVKVIESDRDRSYRLVEILQNASVVYGDGRDIDLLKEEGIKDTDAFIALGNNSEANILSCISAKRFGVSKTIAEVEDMDYIDIAERMDIGNVINKKIMAAGKIYHSLLEEDVSNIKCLTFAKASVAELIAKKDSRITQEKVKDLHLPEGFTLGGLIRNGEGKIITGDTQIQEGDFVVVFFLETAIGKIETYFS